MMISALQSIQTYEDQELASNRKLHSCLCINAPYVPSIQVNLREVGTDYTIISTCKHIDTNLTFSMYDDKAMSSYQVRIIYL